MPPPPRRPSRVQPRRLVPRERARALEPARAQLVAPRDRLLDARGDRGDVERVDEHRRAAGDLLASRRRAEVTTGAPHAIASSTGMPKPS